MKNIITVENLSKQYRLGLIGTGTLSHDLNRWWHTIRGKEDPYLKVGELNDRSTKGSSEYVWALKDVNFTVENGEILGIIGKNGAGKSTLLKLLSRVTAPTTGKIVAHGRIASLLEVGTGFHPELTGRENIYLNGSILGMTVKEIKSKFDEIVDFAGCERYIDTPVKRYSSGMYVRLAFAVAAHLEPEILVVDEVLAVGDAEFQKKAVGKMKDVSSQDGRTVLFVSHNMASIRDLCTRTLIVKNGQIGYDGPVNEGIDIYKRDNVNDVVRKKIKFPLKDIILQIELLSVNVEKMNNDIVINFEINAGKLQKRFGIGVEVKSDDGIRVSRIGAADAGNLIYDFEGFGKFSLTLNNILKNLNNGGYTLTMWFSIPGYQRFFVLKDFETFQIEEYDFYGLGHHLDTKDHGYLPLKAVLSRH